MIAMIYHLASVQTKEREDIERLIFMVDVDLLYHLAVGWVP